MTHRPPTAADIGKTVEVSDDGESWRERELHMIGKDFVRVMLADDGVESWRHCRVPYSSPDPIAELSEAADLLAERGADEAARVLMQFLAMDAITQNAFLAYRPGDSVTLYHTLLNELEPPHVR